MNEEKSEIYLFVKTCLLFAYHTVCVMQEGFTNFSLSESLLPILFFLFQVGRRRKNKNGINVIIQAVLKKPLETKCC